MKKTIVKPSVADATAQLSQSLKEKGFTIFADVDHQANANTVDLNMPDSRVLIFGNPVSGTTLMQKDIAMSLDLPLRLAVVDMNGTTVIIHQTSEDYTQRYDVEGHPILDKVEGLFKTLISELSA